MEDENKKKKRNKKKKNKQNKTAEGVADGDQSHVSNGQNDESQSQVSEAAANVETDEQDPDVYPTRNGSNGGDSGILEEIIRQLQKEKDFHIQKEATLEDTINQLQKENNLHLQKEFTFQAVIKQLRDENNSYNQNKASLEMKLFQLQSEKDSWLRKEGQLEDKISQLVDEKKAWDLTEVSLKESVKHLETEKHSWILKEGLNKEMISNLNDDIARLRVQVVELEDSKNNLILENQQLLGNINNLQTQIKDLQSIASTHSSEEFMKLSSEREELNSQVEAACGLVEKLISENAELVEKVNELFIELHRHGGLSELPSTLASESILETAENSSFPHKEPETNENIAISGQELNSTESEPVKEGRNGIHNHNSDYHHVDVITEPSISEVSGEIVQIPLDENEVRDLEVQVPENDENVAVPMSDAPLIGAPFRLISFVSRYVSGADLVNKNSLEA